MDVPSDLLLRVPEEAARLLALAQLAEVAPAAARLGDAKDDEALHDFRVALRRLRSTLRSWRRLLSGSVRKKDRDAWQDLQRATGTGRDAEVGADWVAQARERLTSAERRGADWLEETLRGRAAKQRQSARREAKRVLEKTGARLAKRLQRYEVAVAPTPRIPRRFASEVARALQVDARGLFDALDAVRGPEHAKEAHEARIAGKRLRYLIEPMRDLLAGVDDVIARLKALQDVLGSIQDLTALGQTVRESLQASSAEHAAALADAAGRGDDAGRGSRPRDAKSKGLLALTREVERAREARFVELLSGWRGGDRPAALRAGLEGLARAAEAAAHVGIEIERKYLLEALPAPLPPGEAVEVEQGWLPGERLQERVRRVRHGAEARCWRTVKTGRGITRVEIEEETSPAIFDALWPLTEGLRVHKRRHVVESDGHRWEIDEFLDRDLVLAEVELADADEKVKLPDWLAPFVVRDVTEEDEYVNRKLAR
jgi:CHAD domain-containing protein/CYTH domain-containing protein